MIEIVNSLGIKTKCQIFSNAVTEELSLALAAGKGSLFFLNQYHPQQVWASGNNSRFANINHERELHKDAYYHPLVSISLHQAQCPG